MKVFGLDIRKVIVAFLVTFAVLTGGRIAAYHVQVERPMEAFLQRRADVAAWQLLPGGGSASGLEVRVKLREVRDLQAAYLQIRDGIARATGRTPCLIIEDTRTAQLSDTYRRMRFAVEEAIARGTFRDMAEAVDALAAEARLDRWNVDVDSRNVYLQLHEGGHYLYEVIPRQDATAPSGEAGADKHAASAPW
ncbi:MAG: hypothetical protein ACM3X3_09230 [Betaproteobacteria bacterium]